MTDSIAASLLLKAALTSMLACHASIMGMLKLLSTGLLRFGLNRGRRLLSRPTFGSADGSSESRRDRTPVALRSQASGMIGEQKMQSESVT